MSGPSAGGEPALGLLTSAAFRTPRHFARSAWIGHVPFAFWLADALRPRRFVELGTYHGMSFLAFCQAIAESGITCQALGVDTWMGDAHAAGSQKGVLERLQAEIDGHYGSFARLARMTFDEAARDMPPGSVDLLHIDGYHTYEAVKHDFETWRDRLAPGAVVLFHDTQVREGDFGVHRFWAEVSKDRPHFEFAHQFGLGVLGWGDTFPPRLEALFRTSGGEADQVREAFERLGRGVVLEGDVRAFTSDRTAQAAIRLRNVAKRILPGLRWPGR
jgi:hypothetical protein